jgi:orotate phosphoribosyltransferase
MTARERVLEHLLTHSVRRGDFTLKSGRKSTWFIDSKQTICAAESMLDVAQLVIDRLPAEVRRLHSTLGASRHELAV